MEKCEFCDAPGTLLCDGQVYGKQDSLFHIGLPPEIRDTKSCDARMCRKCATKVSSVHLKTSKGCRWDTIDLCPVCNEAELQRKLMKGDARVATAARAYAAGYNAGRYGPTASNSHFSFFATPELREEWERGKAEATSSEVSR